MMPTMLCNCFQCKISLFEVSEPNLCNLYRISNDSVRLSFLLYRVSLYFSLMITLLQNALLGNFKLIRLCSALSLVHLTLNIFTTLYSSIVLFVCDSFSVFHTSLFKHIVWFCLVLSLLA